jgi:UDP-hydrolysing UDP-N-acetyl-D-glucosamine 2-epimerase
MKVLGFTGSRADYYLQQPLFKRLNRHPKVDLQIIVSGSILEERNQKTLNDIHEDNISIAAYIRLSDSSNHSIQVANLLLELDPIVAASQADIALVYADRYESFAFALACFHQDLVVMHLEAGDITEGGTYDDSIRHCITKLSHIQAASTDQGVKVIRAMGEQPWRSVRIGLLSYESLADIPLEEAISVADSLGIRQDRSLVVATMHPIPMDLELTRQETIEFLSGLEYASQTDRFNIVLTAPNRDHGSEVISNLISEWVTRISGCIFIESLGGFRYQSLLSLARVRNVIVCGNSSSVVKEAPFYGAHGLNVGRRQSGREKAESQVDVVASGEKIAKALLELSNIVCTTRSNPYLSSCPSEKVVDFLLETFESHSHSELLLKRWHWCPYSPSRV